jgi:gliding motility-associated-like protein
LAPLPIIDFGNDKNICSGDSVLLTYTPSYIYHTYFWFPASGLSCVDCSSPYASPLATTKYYLTTSTSQGCTVSDSITINVNPKPNMYSLTTSSPYCEVNGRLNITTLNNNFAPYLFNLNNQGFSSQIEYQNLDAGSYHLQIKDKNGCIHDTSFVLDVNSDRETINIPNCFTPNGDQANELWLIKGSCIMNFECKIFNRWGEEVASFNNTNNGWDGKNKNGLPVTDGIYFYVIDITYYSEQRSKKSGYISLFR